MDFPATQLRVHVRWMIRGDMPRVIAIDQASYLCPWDESEYLAQLRARNCIGLVAEHHDKVVGSIVYELTKSRLNVLRMCVDPSFRRSGIGSQFVRKLISKLSPHRRNRIIFHVEETNDGAILFLSKLGFIANLERGYYDNEDAYCMTYYGPCESVPF